MMEILFCAACGTAHGALRCPECQCPHVARIRPTEGALCEECPEEGTCQQLRKEAADAVRS
jgi:hypothetical protein